MVFKCLGFGRSKKHSSSSNKSYPTVIEELCRPFSMADLQTATNNFDESNVIGQGGFGKVYKGCLQLDHVATAVAVKGMSKSSMQGLETFNREIELLCQLRCPNLISLIGFCIHKHEIIIVYEYMSNGSLTDHIFKRDEDDDREPLSWKKRLEICIGVARGLHYLHSGLKRTIIHRDIKPSTILLDDNMVPKLCDFGLSVQGQLFTEKPKPIKGKSLAGTLGYIAPESFREGILTDKFDVYSFGVVLYEVVCGKSIFTIVKEMNDFEEVEMFSDGSDRIPTHSYIMLKLQAEDIDPGLVGNIAPECYALYIDIIDRCLKLEPDERPIMGEVEVLLEHALILQEEAYATCIAQTQQQQQQQQQEAPMSA